MPAAMLFALLPLADTAGAADTTSAVIARNKASVVAVGTYERTRSPPFEFRGTGFAVDDGTLIVTNAHVLAALVDSKGRETMGILVPVGGSAHVEFREARQVAADPSTDLGVLKIGGSALPALAIGNSDEVREGQSVLFTGFPIGSVLGPYPATHRGMVAAISPIAIPQRRSGQLSPKVILRLTSGAFPVFQLDATAYPGNSGSPVYDAERGEVIGIINMVLVKGTKESALTQPSGITYAVPAKYLLGLLQKIR